MSNIGQISGGSDALTNKALSILKGNAADAQSELKKLFEEKYFNNGQTGIDDIDKKIKQIQKMIDETQKKIDNFNDKINKNNMNIEEKSNELGDVMNNIASTMPKYQVEMEEEIKGATSAAIMLMQSQTDRISGMDDEASAQEFTRLFLLNFNKNAGSKYINSLDGLFEKQDSISGEIKGYVGVINGYIKENDALCKEMTNAKSTVALLKETQKNLTKQQEGYKNVDNNSSVPVYSPAKEAFVDDLLVKYTSRIDDTINDSKNPNAKTLTPDQINAGKADIAKKYGVPENSQYKSGDKYNSSTNPELSYFNKAIQGGMLTELSQLGLNRTEIIDFIAQNFDVGIAHQDNGSYTVPYGHGGDAKNIYTNFRTAFDQQTGTKVDPNKTIDGNNQLKELQNAIEKDGLLKQFKDKGFSYKETMYALTKLFPGAGIGYDLSTQGTPNYTLPYGDDDATHKLMQTISNQTDKNWGVKATMGKDPSKDKPGDEKRTDPIGFKIGDTNYEFLTADAMDNGKFDGINEMLGSKNGMQDLQDLAKSLGATNGVIQGEDALKQVVLMEMKHVKQPDGSYKLEPSFTNAWDAGIRSIDTNAVAKQDSKAGGASTDYTNINNALVQNTFNITMNDGSTVTGEQKYETNEYIKQIYGKGFGENIYSQLSDAKIDNIFADNKFTNGDMADKLEDLKDQAEDASRSPIYKKEDAYEIINGFSEGVEDAISAGYYSYKKTHENGNVQFADSAQNKPMNDAMDAAVNAARKGLTELDKSNSFYDVIGKSRDEVSDEVCESTEDFYENTGDADDEFHKAHQEHRE